MEVLFFILFSRSPASFLKSGQTDSSYSQAEPRASSAYKAAFYLDAALRMRSNRGRGFSSHMVFTFHIYQYAINDKTGRLTGGRSRLHLVNLKGCVTPRCLSGLCNLFTCRYFYI